MVNNILFFGVRPFVIPDFVSIPYSLLLVQFCSVRSNIRGCCSNGISYVWSRYLVSDNFEYATSCICFKSCSVDNSKYDIVDSNPDYRSWMFMLSFWERVIIIWHGPKLFYIDHLQVINPFTKYALLMNPLARSIEELLPAGISNNYWCFILLRTALVFSSVCAAFLLPFFSKFRTWLCFYFILIHICSEVHGILF